MYLIIDTLSNNVLAECGNYAAAEQQRIQLIGANPELAEYIEVIDMDRELEAYDHATVEADTPRAQPA